MNKKKIGFKSEKENFDTATPQGRFVLTIFSALAELERESILQRQSEGIDAAKIWGVKFGRLSLNKPENWDLVILQWKECKIKAVEAFKELRMTKSSFYKMLKSLA